MTDFIRHESQMQRIPTLLTRAVGFRESPEYKELRPYELDIPGVVSGAFAKYLSRIHAEENSDAARSMAHEPIASAHQALDALASSPETAVQNLVADEIFENLEGSEQVMARIEIHLLPHALSLYERWRAERGGTQ
jgi:hypothetical protein